jgi:exopolysaccharide biosynthesis polyprenyl glycosylphosphotransferase
MTFITDIQKSSLPTDNLDLRAPSTAQLRKRIGSFWLRQTVLISLDGIGLFLGSKIPEIFTNNPVYPWVKEESPSLLFVILGIHLGFIALQGLYAPGKNRGDYFKLIRTISLSYLLFFVLNFLNESTSSLSVSIFIASWLLSISLTCMGRIVVDIAIKRFRKQGVIKCPTYIISSSKDRQKATKFLEKQKCYNLVGWGDANRISSNKANLETILEEISQLNVAEVFICSWQSLKNRMFLYWQLRNAGVIVHILPIELDAVEQELDVKMIGGIPVLNFQSPTIAGIDFWVKRSFDICCAALFVLLASPIYLLIALLIRLDSPGPIFFHQTRIGLHGRPFKVWKFRTMVTNAEQLIKELEATNEMKDGVLFKMKDDPRITALGKFLRRYSLDELPQLFNVVLGEMSLVGPRPLPVRDVEKFAKHHFIREEVLPGVTGLWQVSGRSNITDFEQVVGLDVSYMENWSLWLDLRILFQTVKVVFAKEGAY